MNKELILRNVRLSYAKIVTPEASASGGKPRYSCNFILEPGHPQLDAVNAILREIETTEFGGKALTGKDTCLRDGNTMTDDDNEVRDGYVGSHYLSAARAEKRKAPRVVDKAKRELRAGEPGFPESGDYVNAKKVDASYGKKACCEIGTVQLEAKGAPLGGGSGFGNLDSLPGEAEDNDDL